MEIDHANRATGGGVVDRAQIQVAELFAREQREAAMADRNDRQIVGHVVMRGDARACPHPDAGERLAGSQVDMVGGVQAVEEMVDVDRGEIDRRCIGMARERGHAREDFRQLRVERAEVHPHRVVIEQPSVDARLADRNGERPVAMMAQQIGASRVRRCQPGLDQRPVGGEAANDERGRGRAQLLIEVGGVGHPYLGYGGQTGERPRTRLSHGKVCGCVARRGRRDARATRSPYRWAGGGRRPGDPPGRWRPARPADPR